MNQSLYIPYSFFMLKHRFSYTGIYMTTSRVALVSLWLGSLMASFAVHATQVFVSRDSQGNLIFSDTATANATTHKVEPLPTVPALKYQKPEANTNLPVIADEGSASNKPPARIDNFEYQFLTILYPRDQDNLPPGRSATLEVMVGLKPGLRQQDTLVLLDNGKPAYSGRDLALSVPNLDPGQHTLQLAIKRNNGDLVQHSEEITIYVQRHSVLRNQANKRTN